MRVAVLFGGLSEERDVSVASGIQAMLALERAGHVNAFGESVSGSDRDKSVWAAPRTRGERRDS